MKYSILLSTIGERETLRKCLNNFQSFLSRPDIELVVATTNSDFKLEGLGRVIYVERPKKVRKRFFIWRRAARSPYFMWRQAADASEGDWVVIVADDLLLSKNFFDRADHVTRKETKVFQPCLLDPQGYVVCGEYFRSYTCAAVRRELVYDFNLTSDPYGDTEWLHSIHKSCNLRNSYEYFFDSESFCWHLGYPIEGGTDSVTYRWNVNKWIKRQRLKFGNRRIDTKENFDNGKIEKKEQTGACTSSYPMNENPSRVNS
jgi:glycosyltransferase involved in cell wall biosynthesis